MSNRFIKRAAIEKNSSPAQSSLVVQKLCIKAIMERKLINDGDKILLAVSGGKDSTVLAWALSAIRPALKVNYELAALHISTDFCACCKKSILSQRLDEWGIPFTDLFVPVIGRLKEGRKMNCYWCSTQRRTELINYAMSNGFNKIALGHHLDDIIETFFMNLCGKGNLSAMPVIVKYRKYPVTLIRPLAWLEEKQIIACAAEQDILKAACTCPYGVNSGRREMREKIASFTGTVSSENADAADTTATVGSADSGAIKRQILRALSFPVDFLSDV